MVFLAPMNESELSRYLAEAVTNFAREKVESGQWSQESALEQSRQGFNELLPQGLATPNNYLFTIQEGATLRVVGMLWFAVQERSGQNIAYVYDVLVKPQFQRQGFATSAFEALEEEVASRGLMGIALHVFGHNAAAIALYRKLGYQTTNINMFKPVPGASSGACKN
jgi:ribosomal protein S18 acetylase RimI-like enzyme